MLIIGLTGSLCTGKTTVSKLLRQKKCIVLDADLIARRSLYKNGACYHKVVKAFGREILSAGRISRKKLADIAFRSKKNLRKLEGVIHPHVEKTFKTKINALKGKTENKVFVLDVPLLFESKMNRLADVVICVAARKEIQLKRAKAKLKLSRQQALTRINSQMSLAKKIKKSNFVIHNNGSQKKLKEQVNKIWQKML